MTQRDEQIRKAFNGVPPDETTLQIAASTMSIGENLKATNQQLSDAAELILAFVEDNGGSTLKIYQHKSL